jgi:hypothetical protein
MWYLDQLKDYLNHRQRHGSPTKGSPKKSPEKSSPMKAPEMEILVEATDIETPKP